MKLNERIKSRRQQSGLTQEQVAEALKVSRQAVTKWENGSSAPSTENLFKLAELFGTTVDFLLKRDEQPKPRPLWKDHRFWISIVLSYFYFLVVTPFEVDMYTPQLFQAFCIMLNLWSVVWFCIFFYMMFSRRPVGENATMFCTCLAFTAVGHGVFCLFFWQCCVNIGVCVVFFTWVLVQKHREKAKISEKST